MKKLILLFLISLVYLATAQSDQNVDNLEELNLLASNGSLRVIEYTVFLSNLPNFSIPFINDFMHSTLNIPYQVSSIVKLGYTTIIVIIGMLFIIMLIVFACLQVFCSCFSIPGNKYHRCQTISAKVIAAIIWFTIVVLCVSGIYYCFVYRTALDSGFDKIQTQINEKRVEVNSVQEITKKINATIANISVPMVINDIEKATHSFDSILNAPQAAVLQLVEKFLPYTVFSILILLAGLGLFSVFKEKRVCFLLSNIFVVLMFLFVLVYAISGSILSLTLSNYCVGGVENHTTTVVEGFVPVTCTRETLNFYLFCTWNNVSCNPFPGFNTQINVSIDETQKKINDDPNNADIKYWNETLKNLESLRKSTQPLASCGSTQQTFEVTSQLFCYDVAKNQVYLASIYQLLTGILFFHLMITFYTWNRIALNNDSEYSRPLLDTDTSIGLRPRRAPQKISKVKSRENPITCDLSIGCFSFLLITLLFVTGLVLAIIFLILFASGDAVIPR